MTREEKILEFCRKTNVINPDMKTTSPEYVYTDALIGDDDEALDVLLHVTFRKPMYLDDLAEKCGKTVEETAVIANRFVWEGHSLVLGRNRRELEEIDKDNADLDAYDTVPRQRPILNSYHAMDFHDPRRPLTREQIERETSRCLGCGAAYVDQGLCIGCGVCTTKCKFDAIHLQKKYDEWGVTYEQLLAALS